MNASTDPIYPSDSASASTRALPFRAAVEHLEIVRMVGESDIGIEYLAIDHRDESEVLLKEYIPARLARREGVEVMPQIPAQATAFAQGLGAFIAEARMLARMEHPALLQASGVVEAHGTAYQVTPHPPGERLLRVRQEMNFAPDEPAVRDLLDALLGAIDTLHQSGMLHGSVSPANIVLTADDLPLLLGPDLTRPKVASDLAESLMVSVEPSFAAPEQLAPSVIRPIGPWSDLYSLAETMRFCISGELPPPASAQPHRGRRESMAELVHRRFGETALARYSPALLATLDVALEPDLAARPRNVAEFRQALGELPEPGQAFDLGVSAETAVAARPAARPEPTFDIDSMLVAVPAARPSVARPPAQAAARATTHTARVPIPQPGMLPAIPPRPERAPAQPPAARAAFGNSGHTDAANAPRAFDSGMSPDGPLSLDVGDAPLASRPPAKRQRAVWAGLGLALALGAGVYSWWRADQPVGVELSAPSGELAWSLLTRLIRPAPAPMAATSAGLEPTPKPIGADPVSTSAPAPAPAPAQEQAPELALTPALVTPAPAVTPIEASPAEPAAALPSPAGTVTPTVPSSGERTRPLTQAKPPVPVQAGRDPPPQAAPTSPRNACGDRTQFALYRCMQTMCAQRGWTRHPQCERLRTTDAVD